MRGYPQFSFWIPKALANICFSHIVINHAKILLVLIGTVLKVLWFVSKQSDLQNSETLKFSDSFLSFTNEKSYEPSLVRNFMKKLIIQWQYKDFDATFMY